MLLKWNDRIPEWLYDVYDGILMIDKILDSGMPNLMPLKKTPDMAKAFRYAKELIREDLSK